VGRSTPAYALNPAHHVRRTEDGRIYYRQEGRMNEPRQRVAEEEPAGIVISRGSRAETTPRVWAYVWGQVPETDAGSVDVKAA
jgi:hypothetical protein